MAPKPRTNANGEGTVYLVRPGRWCGQAYVVDQGGTRRRATVYDIAHTRGGEPLALLLGEHVLVHCPHTWG